MAEGEFVPAQTVDLSLSWNTGPEIIWRQVVANFRLPVKAAAFWAPAIIHQ